MDESDTENCSFTTPLNRRSRPIQCMTNATPETSPDNISLANTLKETNNLLLKISSRMDMVDKKISDIEAKVSITSSSTPSRNRKKEVPTEVRVM